MNTLTSSMLVVGILLLGWAADAGTALPSSQRSVAPVMATSLVVAEDLPSDASADSLTAVVQQYCVVCHSDALKTGNLTLAAFDVAKAEQNAETAEKMIRKLRAGMMPPPGAPRPDPSVLTDLVVTLETRVDDAAADHPNPGRRSFQRLTRADYVRSIQDLLGMEVDINAFLPTETVSNNFDNIADVQNPSATLLQGYLRAAAHVSVMAVGDPTAIPGSTTYKVPRTASQLERAEGAPFGTRGGLSVTHTFPADGDYIFRIELHPGPTGFLFGMTSRDEQLEISIDGERAALVDIDRWMSESDPNGMRIEMDPIHVRAGPHRVTAAFIRQSEGPANDLLTPVDHTLADTQIGSAYGVTTVPHLRDLAIVGPYRVTGVSDTPTRRRIFTCRPTSPEEARPCARDIVSRLAAQAYRRPLTENDVLSLMTFYDVEAERGGFEAGIRIALQAILASPHFIFRFEETPSDVLPGDIYRISDNDLASRLSFFLWARPPDEELVELATRGELSDPRVLERQVRRMLADPRSESLGERFASQWLRLQDLMKLHPDAQLYPYYDQTLALAMKHETELFFNSLVREDRSMLELLTADYTFVNERLAKHYGIPGVTGRDFRRVTYPDDKRRGLLGHGSVLALTSHANRTSPVLRGKWVMEVLLGTPPPPPPAGVPDLEQTEGTLGGRMLTTRERMEQHRASPVCRSCHRFMDPIGLALDNFDVTGKWRIRENGIPLDTRGEMYDGTPLASTSDLLEALLSRPTPLVRNFTVNLMAYALGRRVEYFDMPAVRKITRHAAANGNRMSSFILGVVNTPAFQMSVMEATDQDIEGGN